MIATTPAHLALAELEAGLAEIAASPVDHGIVRAIVIRPRKNERQDVTTCEISLAGGVDGDSWARKSWIKTDDGQPHPDAQICIMNARAIDLIAGGVRDNWTPAGDNLFIDLDLSENNLKPGQHLAIGSAVIEITAEPHLGCAKFSKRYGREAVQFVNKGDGPKRRLRGVYARVVQDGRVSVGDVASKVAPAEGSVS
jgi:MOSC domain-containing protein YiiM